MNSLKYPVLHITCLQFNEEQEAEDLCSTNISLKMKGFSLDTIFTHLPLSW